MYKLNAINGPGPEGASQQHLSWEAAQCAGMPSGTGRKGHGHLILY